MYNKKNTFKIDYINESQMEISINYNLILGLSRGIRDCFTNDWLCELQSLELPPLSGVYSLSLSLCLSQEQLSLLLDSTHAPASAAASGNNNKVK